MNYDMEYLNEKMMGSNMMVIAKELIHKLPLKKGMKVLELAWGLVKI